MTAPGDPAGTPTDQVRLAVSAARDAAAVWSQRKPEQRCRMARSLVDLLLVEGDAIARTLATDLGRSAVDAWILDLAPALAALAHAADHGLAALAPAPVPHTTQRHRASYVRARPVPALLAAWTDAQHSLVTGAEAIAAAIVGGHALVLCPAEGGASACTMLVELARRAGLPPDLVSVQPQAEGMLEAIIDADPDRLWCAGDRTQGARIATLCAQALVPCRLRLSARASALVLSDADLDAAAAEVAWSATAGLGQHPDGIGRVLVHREIAGAFEARLVAALATPGAAPPTLSAAGTAQVEGATAAGGRLLSPPPGEQALCATVVADCPPDQVLWTAPRPGPVLAIHAYDTEHQLVSAAQRLGPGQAAAVFGQDRGHARSVAEQLASSVVMVNTALPPGWFPAGARRAVRPMDWSATGDDLLADLSRVTLVNHALLPQPGRAPWQLPHQDTDLARVRALCGLYWASGAIRRSQHLLGVLRPRSTPA